VAGVVSLHSSFFFGPLRLKSVEFLGARGDLRLAHFVFLRRFMDSCRATKTCVPEDTCDRRFCVV
jgi:hypothetical protein